MCVCESIVEWAVHLSVCFYIRALYLYVHVRQSTGEGVFMYI